MESKRIQNPDYQDRNDQNGPKPHFTYNHTDKEPPPDLISRKWLCHRFQLVHPGGRLHYAALYKTVLTPDVVAQAGIDPAKLNRRGPGSFDRRESLALIDILRL